MYELKKSYFLNDDPSKKDMKYLLDILRKFGVSENTESILFPNEAITPLKDASISDDEYDYFQLVWANEECEVSILDIVGSHDYRNLTLKTWLQNFLINDVGKRVLESYLSSPASIFDSKEHPLLVFEKDKEYYIADGHHRFSALYLHYHILKSQNKLPNDFPVTLKAQKRVVPNNTDFIKRFNAFCIKNHLYYEDEYGVIPFFEIVDSNPDSPIIRYSQSDILIEPNTNLDEILIKIKEADDKRKK